MQLQRNSKMYFFAAAFLVALALVLGITGADIRICITMVLAAGAFVVIALKHRKREKDQENQQ
ncbi:MAG: hypothetical protein IJM76_02635 [Lachnospiraceae bacterium]|nr:hypothetical protein [Lachnospiraceae bacterium]